MRPGKSSTTSRLPSSGIPPRVLTTPGASSARSSQLTSLAGSGNKSIQDDVAEKRAVPSASPGLEGVWAGSRGQANGPSGPVSLTVTGSTVSAVSQPPPLASLTLAGVPDSVYPHTAYDHDGMHTTAAPHAPAAGVAITGMETTPAVVPRRSDTQPQQPVLSSAVESQAPPAKHADTYAAVNGEKDVRRGSHYQDQPLSTSGSARDLAAGQREAIGNGHKAAETRARMPRQEDEDVTRLVDGGADDQAVGDPYLHPSVKRNTPSGQPAGAVRHHTSGGPSAQRRPPSASSTSMARDAVVENAVAQEQEVDSEDGDAKDGIRVEEEVDSESGPQPLSRSGPTVAAHAIAMAMRTHHHHHHHHHHHQWYQSSPLPSSEASGLSGYRATTAGGVPSPKHDAASMAPIGAFSSSTREQPNTTSSVSPVRTGKVDSVSQTVASASTTGITGVPRFPPYHHHHHHTASNMRVNSPPTGANTPGMASPYPSSSLAHHLSYGSSPNRGGAYHSSGYGGSGRADGTVAQVGPHRMLSSQPLYGGYPAQPPQVYAHPHTYSGGSYNGQYSAAGGPTMASGAQTEADLSFSASPSTAVNVSSTITFPPGSLPSPTTEASPAMSTASAQTRAHPSVSAGTPTTSVAPTAAMRRSPTPPAALSPPLSASGPHYSSSPSHGPLTPAQHSMPAIPPLPGSAASMHHAALARPLSAGPSPAEGGVRRDGPPYGRGGGGVPGRYASTPPPALHSAHNGSPTGAGPAQSMSSASAAAVLLYDHQVNSDELWVEDRKSELPFSADVYGNIACLISAISPQVSVSHELEIPSQCNATFDNGTGLSGPVVPTHPQDVDSATAGTGELSESDAERPTRSGGAGVDDREGEKSETTGCSNWDALGHYRYYRQFSGPSFSEPVARLWDIWEGFDSPFGYVVHLAQPVQLTGMKPPEDQVVYEPLLSGFRIGFHDAAPAYHHVAALRGVKTDRFPETHARHSRAAAAAATELKHAPAKPQPTPDTETAQPADPTGTADEDAFSAVDVGVLSWSAAERPDSRFLVTRQIQELAHADPLFEPLLTATTADIDHRSWVAILWQPVFIGGHSSKHSCGAFLAYYMLRPPRHLFMPFAERSYGAAMNSAWSSPAFRADRAVINFDMWSFHRNYDVGRPVLPPTGRTLSTKKTASTQPKGTADTVTRTAEETASLAAMDADDEVSSHRSVEGVAARRARVSPTATTTTTITTPHSFSAANAWGQEGTAAPGGRDGCGGQRPLHATAPPVAPAASAPFICIPVVGLVPSRCRSDAWFVLTDYPLDPNQLPSRQLEKGTSGAATSPCHVSSPSTSGASGGGLISPGGASHAGTGGGTSGTGGLAHAGHSSTTKNPNNAASSRPQDLVWPYRAPLFFLATALQLMCWNAYEEHLRRGRLRRRKAASLESRTATASSSTDPTSPTRQTATQQGECGIAARRGSLLPPPLQADAVVMANVLGFAGVPHGDGTDPVLAADEVNGSSDEEVPYYRCGVQLMNRSAQAYRQVREAAKIDQAMEEVAASSHALARHGSRSSGATKRHQSRQDCPMAVAGGCSTGIDSVVRGDGAYSASLATVVGLLDFYRWVQFDTSLQAFAENYCQS